MKGFKVRTAIAVAGAALMLTAACGEEAPEGPQPLDTTQEVTLTFWWWGDENRAALTQQQIDLFHDKYPYITIEGEPQTFDRYFDNVSTKFAANDAPDIITMGGAYPKSFGSGGNLLNLKDPSVAGEIDIAQFTDSILASATADGEVYGVPTGGNALALLINPAIFQQAGVAVPDDDAWSWDDFVNTANEISAKLSSQGIYGAETRLFDIIGAYAGQKGGLYDDQDNVKVSEGDLAGLFDIEKRLLDGGGVPPADLLQQVLTVDPPQTLFGQGRSAMIFGYTNQVGTYADASGAEVELLRIPGESQAGQSGTTLLPSQYFTININTRYPRHAALFVDFLVNDIDSGSIILANRGMPSSPKVASAIGDKLNANDKKSANFLADNAATFGPSFIPPSWATDINRITQTVDSQLIAGQLTPQQAAAEWIKQMNDSQEANQE